MSKTRHTKEWIHLSSPFLLYQYTSYSFMLFGDQSLRIKTKFYFGLKLHFTYQTLKHSTLIFKLNYAVKNNSIIYYVKLRHTIQILRDFTVFLFVHC